MDRVKTGIEGLDEMLNGGIPKNRHVTLYGGPGTGKTSFAFEYIYKGAQQGEAGVYISLEETAEDIISNMKTTFPMFEDVEKLINSKKMEIIKPDTLGLDGVAGILEDRILSNKIKRVVIDSLTIMKMTSGVDEYRPMLFEFLSLLRGLDCTSMTTLEASKINKETVEYDIEHFVMDGIINLYNLDRKDKRIRALEIFKLRGTNHSRDLVPFKVTPSGIKVYTGEKVF
ncbi:MAG: ATPase domain-containing protein [Candidatus ainarchaeum sp.]|nr:ATPase domain-containing protein [Candidatus ainarchaeum sp.]